MNTKFNPLPRSRIYIFWWLLGGIILLCLVLSVNIAAFIPLTISFIVLLMVSCFFYLIYLALIHNNHQIYHNHQSIMVKSIWGHSMYFEWQDIKNVQKKPYSIVVYLHSGQKIIVHPFVFDIQQQEITQFFYKLMSYPNL